MAFKLKSGNKTPFKSMGSSPLNMFGGPQADRPLGLVGKILDPLGIFAPKDKKEDGNNEGSEQEEHGGGSTSAKKTTEPMLSQATFAKLGKAAH